MFASVSSSKQATHAQIQKCIGATGDGIIKSDQSTVVLVLHNFGLSHTIGFQAAVSVNFTKRCRGTLRSFLTF